MNLRIKKSIEGFFSVLFLTSLISIILFSSPSYAGIYFNSSGDASHNLSSVNATNGDFSDDAAPGLAYAYFNSGLADTTVGRFRVVNDSDGRIFSEVSGDTEEIMTFYVSWTGSSASNATLKVTDSTNGEFQLYDCSGLEEADCTADDEEVNGTQNGDTFIFNFGIHVQEFCNTTSADDIDSMCASSGTYDTIESTTVDIEVYGDGASDPDETLTVTIYFSDNGPSSGVSVAAGRGDGQIYLDTSTASVSSSDEPESLAVAYGEAAFTCAETDFVGSDIRSYDYSDDDFYELELTGLTNDTTYSGCVALTNLAKMVGFTGGSVFSNVTPSEVSGLLEDSHCFIATSAWGSTDREPGID
jgi:hypothetical protein